MQSRLYEASKLGAKSAIIPAANITSLKSSDLAGMEIVRTRTLRGALVHLFGETAISQPSAAAARGMKTGGGAKVGRSRKDSTSSSSSSGRRRKSTSSGNGGAHGSMRVE